MGADTFIDLTSWKWRRSKDVLSLLDGRLLVIHRAMDHNATATATATGCNESSSKTKNEENEGIAEQVELRLLKVNEMFGDNGVAKAVHVPHLSSISSTIVRSTKDIGQLTQWLSNEVVAYMKDNCLYRFSEDNSFDKGDEKKD